MFEHFRFPTILAFQHIEVKQVRLKEIYILYTNYIILLSLYYIYVYSKIAAKYLQQQEDNSKNCSIRSGLNNENRIQNINIFLLQIRKTIDK